VAYTPRLVVGVWVGYDDGRPLNLTGSRSALPIVASFLEDALRRDRSKEFPMPEGIELVRLEKGGWWIFGGGCSDEPEAFLVGTAPESDCGPLTP
jgi:membrane carboxypeptidase/penicillin-binding protein